MTQKVWHSRKCEICGVIYAYDRHDLSARKCFRCAECIRQKRKSTEELSTTYGMNVQGAPPAIEVGKVVRRAMGGRKGPAS